MEKVKFNGKLYDYQFDAANHCYWIQYGKGMLGISAFDVQFGN